MTRPRTIISALAVTIGLLGACGGDSDTSSESTDDAATTTEATTTVATTEPPATDPPTTTAAGPDLPDWASGELVTVGSDTGPLEMPVELAPFCESSRSFFIAAKALDYLEEGQEATAQQLFAALAALSPATIETAPSEEFAVEPLAAQEQLAVLIPAFEQVGYGPSGLQDLPDPDAVLDTVAEFGETRESLQTFLVEACGADEAVLLEQAQGAATAAAGATGETIEPEAPVEAAAGDPITNSADNITVSVPPEWTETGEFVDNGRLHLVASSDLAGFEDRTAPGVFVLRGEGGFRDGGFVGRVLDYESDLVDQGCVAVEERDYNDGTYIGQERVYDCGVDGLDVRLFGGATADESLYAMVLLVNPIDEPGIRQLIINSFLVG